MQSSRHSAATATLISAATATLINANPSIPRLRRVANHHGTSGNPNHTSPRPCSNPSQSSDLDLCRDRDLDQRHPDLTSRRDRDRPAQCSARRLLFLIHLSILPHTSPSRCLAASGIFTIPILQSPFRCLPGWKKNSSVPNRDAHGPNSHSIQFIESTRNLLTTMNAPSQIDQTNFFAVAAATAACMLLLAASAITQRCPHWHDRTTPPTHQLCNLYQVRHC